MEVGGDGAWAQVLTRRHRVLEEGSGRSSGGGSLGQVKPVNSHMVIRDRLAGPAGRSLRCLFQEGRQEGLLVPAPELGGEGPRGRWPGSQWTHVSGAWALGSHTPTISVPQMRKEQRGQVTHQATHQEAGPPLQGLRRCALGNSLWGTHLVSEVRRRVPLPALWACASRSGSSSAEWGETGADSRGYNEVLGRQPEEVLSLVRATQSDS